MWEQFSILMFQTHCLYNVLAANGYKCLCYCVFDIVSRRYTSSSRNMGHACLPFLCFSDWLFPTIQVHNAWTSTNMYPGIWRHLSVDCETDFRSLSRFPVLSIKEQFNESWFLNCSAVAPTTKILEAVVDNVILKKLMRLLNTQLHWSLISLAVWSVFIF